MAAALDERERAELARTVRDLLSKHTHPGLPLADALTAPDAVWPRLAGELGLAGLLVPERFGGLDLGLAAAATVAEELGRACYSGPFQSSCVEATVLLRNLDHPLAADLLTDLADGGRLACAALSPGSLRADRRGVLSGTSPVVPDLARADSFLVVAPVDGEPAVLAMPEALDPATVRPAATLDLGRQAAAADFDGTPAVVLARGPAAAAAVSDALVHRGIVVGADSVGVAAHALELAVDHVGKRVQFGRVLGSFQAIKHTLADLHVRLEVARSALAYALADAGPRGAHALLATAPEAAVVITTEALQLHGGLGFTWEYPAHVLLRRARTDAALFGTPAEHRRALFHLIDNDPVEEAP